MSGEEDGPAVSRDESLATTPSANRTATPTADRHYHPKAYLCLEGSEEDQETSRAWQHLREAPTNDERPVTITPRPSNALEGSEHVQENTWAWQQQVAPHTKESDEEWENTPRLSLPAENKKGT